MTITEEDDVTTTIAVAVETPAPEGLDFRYLSPDGALAKGFDAALAQARAATEAAMADAARAEKAGSERVHLRLDGWLRSAAAPAGAQGRDAAELFTPAPEYSEAVRKAMAAREAAEPLAALPEAQEEAMGNFLAAHDAEDAREAEAAPEPDEHDISDEEFEAAKAELIARFGAIPASLQRVIDRGGRFARQVTEITADAPETEPGTEDEEPAEAEAQKPPDPTHPAAAPGDGPAAPTPAPTAEATPESASPAAALPAPSGDESAPDEAPAPVAEDVPEPVSEPQQDDEGETT